MRKALWLLVLVLTGCSAFLGGPGPIEYDTAAVHFESATTPEQAAEVLRAAQVEAVLLSTTADTAWVRQLATLMNLVSTRPGRINDLNVAFLAGKPEGDTTLTLKTASGANVRMHDALYKLDKYRWLDLMTIYLDANAGARETARTLLNYIATDVKSDAFTAMAIHTTNRAVSDSIAQLTRAVWADVGECMQPQPAAGSTMRLYYFPPARVNCTSARPVSGGVVARLIFGR